MIGSFNLETGEAVAGSDERADFDVIDALEQLVDAGLIVEEQGDREPLHRVLEPIRQHVADRLDASERVEAARRHGWWFTELARRVAVGSIGSRFGFWADLVERELANFRQAHRWAIENGDIERAVDIVDGLAVVGTERGLMELADWCDATVAMAAGRDDNLEVAALAAAAGFWGLQTESARSAVLSTAWERSPATLSTTSPCENTPFRRCSILRDGHRRPRSSTRR